MTSQKTMTTFKIKRSDPHPSMFRIILADNKEIQERKAFEFHCSGNTKVITGIKVIGKTGKIKIRAVPRYKYY